ncbi:MAG: hypothetical protein KDB03_24815 [Planctomycetales bacterium]|nr:hypothetical protein [Planctomycetales bacterium]
MTPYHEVFIPIFLMGILIAGGLSLLAGMRSGCLIPGILLVGGTLSLWAALFLGSDMGYRAWQKMPDPPDEAFSDASVLGAFVMGWFPASIFCIIVFGTVRSVRCLLHWANPDVFPSTNIASIAPGPEETMDFGNPYQSPRS